MNIAQIADSGPICWLEEVAGRVFVFATQTLAFGVMVLSAKPVIDAAMSKSWNTLTVMSVPFFISTHFFFSEPVWNSDSEGRPMSALQGLVDEVKHVTNVKSIKDDCDGIEGFHEHCEKCDGCYQDQSDFVDCCEGWVCGPCCGCEEE
jgi:hypothetical protein